MFGILGCGGEASTALVPDAGTLDSDSGASDAAGMLADGELKPLPRGVFESTAGVRSPDHDVVGARTPDPATGVMVKVAWDLCETECLLDTIEAQLDAAHARGLTASLVVLDGASAPASLRARCEAFDFDFRGAPRQMCLPWDPAYLEAKVDLLEALGARLDVHPALAYVYFTAACSTNGAEGHCRVDEAAYAAAGYSQSRLIQAYRTIMAAQQAAFLRTPIAFEVHAIFGGAQPWAALWEDVKDSGRVGVAAWWCAERLSLLGSETVPVWPLVQEAAARSFSVCQTVGNFSSQPYRFSEDSLGLDYGTEADWTPEDAHRAFEQTMDWALGHAGHGGQGPIAPFTVLEPWTQDVGNPAFIQRLREW